MKKIIALMSLTHLLAGTALADPASLDIPSDSRIKLLPYDEADVYTIPTKYGYQTNIVFSPQEEIETISLGDRSLWQIIPSGNRLFIRPMEENVITNMTVLTSRHSYQFDLKSGSAKDDEVVYVAKFIYPRRARSTASMTPPAPPGMGAPPSMMPPPAMEPPSGVYVPYRESAPMHEPAARAAASAGNHMSGLNYNYTFSGPDALAPLQVYDDGRSTFISYRNMTEALPNIYVSDASGNEKQIAYYIENNMMVINKVVGVFSLKNSTGTINVYNETLNPER